MAVIIMINTNKIRPFEGLLFYCVGQGLSLQELK